MNKVFLLKIKQTPNASPSEWGRRRKGGFCIKTLFQSCSEQKFLYTITPACATFYRELL